MREIKYKAKHTKTGEWYYGSSTYTDLCAPSDYLLPLSLFWQQVEDGWLDKDTVGQCAPLKDISNTEVYEGDLLRCESNVIKLQTGQPTGEKRILYYEVVFHEAIFTTKRIDNGYITLLAPSPSIWKRYYKVIGNIHDHPELVKGG